MYPPDSNNITGGRSTSGVDRTAGAPAPPGGVLPHALSRWTEAAARLGLGGPAQAAGALLLAAEMDESTRARILGEDAATVAPRRSDLLGALAADFTQEQAAAALAALEERGVAMPLKSYAGPWLAAELELDPRVRGFCLGAARPPMAHADAGSVHPLSRIDNAIREIAARCAPEPARYLVILRGHAGSGRDFALGQLLSAFGAHALQRTVHELRKPVDPLEPELSGSAAVWDPRRCDPSPDDYEIARRWLSRSPTAAVAVLDRHQDTPDVEGRICLSIDVDPASAAERLLGWSAALQLVGLSAPLAEAAARALGHRKRCGVGLAVRAAAMLGDRARQDAATLVAAVEEQLAALVNPSTTRGIIVERPSIPLAHVVAGDDVLSALRHVILLAQLSPAVETAGRVGVKALLSGPSGAGKTMAARAIAAELGLPLYRIDLAAVVSKWVGETEKNLRDALVAAESAGAVLLFDEGDALFGKRGEVSRGSDRYANTQVAYLLQAVEAYDGIVIVTTNLRNNLDTAFERRFDACIELQPPTAEERAAIWRQELGEAGANLPEATLANLAKRAELHGGSIAAAARVARVLALHHGRERVSENDIRQAVRGELLKTGSSVQAARWMKEDE